MIAIIKEVYQYRQILLTLALRDIKARYKQTFLGIAWALCVPLITMVIFSLVFTKFIKIDTRGIPYPIFAYCGILPWTFFATSLSFATESLVRNAGVFSNIYLPKEVFPLASIIASFIDFCFGSVILFGLIIFYRTILHSAVLIVPFILVIQLILTIGLGFIFAMINLFFRDMKYLFQILIPLWMFATPVVYEVPKRYQWVYKVNPIAPIISAYRSLLLEGKIQNTSNLAVSCIISLCIFFIGLIWFHKSENLFAESV